MGTVIEEHEDRLEVNFEHVGHKVIRSVELLEDLESTDE
ncbi:MAG: DUF3553 domain-containing protein [Deltaproteobacteria bacterium]|nr:DUF3553 domain-containing protein [Deltaproteobacteria bacterium]